MPAVTVDDRVPESDNLTLEAVVIVWHPFWEQLRRRLKTCRRFDVDAEAERSRCDDRSPEGVRPLVAAHAVQHLRKLLGQLLLWRQQRERADRRWPVVHSRTDRLLGDRLFSLIVENEIVIRGSPIAHEGTNRSLVDLVALQQPKRSNLAEKVQQPPLDAVEEARAVAWHVKHREPEALYALDGVVDRGADHLARREPVVGRQVGLFGRPVVGRAFLMKRKRNEKKRK